MLLCLPYFPNLLYLLCLRHPWHLLCPHHPWHLPCPCILHADISTTTTTRTVTIPQADTSCSAISPSMSITKFLKNCDVVVWCTKLTHSDANEPVNARLLCVRKCWAGSCVNLLGIGRPRSMR